jgi:hypothetical protein
MMLTRVAICRDAASGIGRDERLMERARLLRTRIQERGIALFASTQDRNAFIDSLPPFEHKCWMELITSQRLVYVIPDGVVASIHTHETLAELRRVYADEADLIVCDRAHAIRIGLDDRYLLTQDERPAVGALPDVDGATALNPDELTGGATDLLPADTLREKIWHNHFAPVAALAEKIVIVDRYLYQQELARKRHSTGLKWFVDRTLADRRTPADLKLEIVVQQASSEQPLDQQLIDAIRRFRLEEPIGPFRSITVWMVATDYVVRNLHDRFIRLDGRVIRLSTGLAVLADERLYQQATVSLGSFKESEKVRQRVASQAPLRAHWHTSSGLWKDPDGRKLNFNDHFQ